MVVDTPTKPLIQAANVQGESITATADILLDPITVETTGAGTGGDTMMVEVVQPPASPPKNRSQPPEPHDPKKLLKATGDTDVAYSRSSNRIEMYPILLNLPITTLAHRTLMDLMVKEPLLSLVTQINRHLPTNNNYDYVTTQAQNRHTQLSWPQKNQLSKKKTIIHSTSALLGL
jgi:hypothetical protein